MDTNNILSASLLDLVFDNRNKDYGAYDLRATYHKRIKKALFITGSLALAAITGTVLASSLKPYQSATVMIHDYTLQKVDDQKPPDPIPPKIPPKPVEPQVRTIAFTTPKIVDKVDEPPPDQDDISKARIDIVNKDGVDDTGPLEIKAIDSKGIIETQKEQGSQQPFTRVEVDAKFMGDWQRFLLKNLRSSTPIDNGAPVGSYKVEIRFVVDVDGSVSDIVALSKNGYGMEEEAVRVLKKAEKWEPAIQNGTHVKAYRTQAIIFQVNEE